MNSLGFFLSSLFYSFFLLTQYFFNPNNYYFLILIPLGLILLIPLKMKFKPLIIIYILLSMSLINKGALNSFNNIFEKIIILSTILITSFFVSRLGINGIVDIFSFFLFIILIIYIFIIITALKIPFKPNITRNNYLLIPLDTAILLYFKPDKIKNKLIYFGYLAGIIIAFFVSVLAFAHYGTFIFEFSNQSRMIFKLQYYFDEIGGYDFIYYYIIPVLCVFRISLNLAMLKSLGFNVIISIFISVLLMGINLSFNILIIISALIYLGGIYGHFKEV